MVRAVIPSSSSHPCVSLELVSVCTCTNTSSHTHRPTNTYINKQTHTARGRVTDHVKLEQSDHTVITFTQASKQSYLGYVTLKVVLL